MSVAVYVPDEAALLDLHARIEGQPRVFRDAVALHLLMESAPHNRQYPMNRMRNLALTNVDTQYFFNDDVDFMPSQNAHDLIRRFMANNTDPHRHHAFYVLPAFEAFGDETGVVTSLKYIPQTRELLRKALDARTVAGFHMEYNAKGQNASNYDRWYACQDEMETYPIQYQWMYEPYVVGSRLAMHLFDDRLRGFGEWRPRVVLMCTCVHIYVYMYVSMYVHISYLAEVYASNW